MKTALNPAWVASVNTPAPSAGFRLFPSTNGPSSSAGSDSTSYTMGLSFKVTSAGLSLKGYWWWVADIFQNTAPQGYGLWTPTGAGTGTVVSGSGLSSGTFSIGWNYTPYVTPIALTQNQEYRAVTTVTVGSGFSVGYSATAHFWDTGPGAAGIVNGPLLAYSGVGGSANNEPFDDAQMVFDNGGTSATGQYPATAFNQTNYWLDVQVG